MTDTLGEFIYTVEKAAEKLTKVVETMPITLVLPPICDTIPELKVKGEFLRDSLKTVKKAKVVNLNNIEMNESQHPTVKGTTDMLTQIHEQIDIILPDCEGDLISSQKYRGVQTLFKTGCRGCNDLTYTHYLCTQCKQDASLVDTLKIEQDIQKLTDEMFPPMGEGTGQKRSSDDNNVKKFVIEANAQAES